RERVQPRQDLAQGLRARGGRPPRGVHRGGHGPRVRRRGRPARPARRVRALHGPAVLRRARRALPRHRGAGRGRRRRRRAVSGTDERTARAPGPSGDPARDDAPGAAFQVALRGVVDLLARHLYSSPRVYLRELLQNAVDAITARGALGDTDGPARIVLRPLVGGGLEVHDTGVGLTRDEAHELLATIGRSSKRDVELGTGREEFLGQFGIGLLSAFMVADEIELVSRSARPSVAGGPAAPVRWRGRSDGRYELVELVPDDPDAPAEPGSVV